MAMNQWVATTDGWGEIVEVDNRSRFGSTTFRVVGEFGDGWYSAQQILSELDDDDTTTEIHYTKDSDGENFSSFPAQENTWLDGGTKLPYNPEPTEEWDGHLTQEFEDHNINLNDTNSLKGHDTHPDPEDHNAIFEHRTSAVGYDAEDSDWEDSDRAEWDDTPKHPNMRSRASVGPRKAFVDYINLIESNSLVREAAWSDVRRKAKTIWDEGRVAVKKNDGREIYAKVEGDHGEYDVQVHRKNAFGQGITWYDCNCEWGKWAYKRQRNFVGRLCSHGLATYYAMQANSQPTQKTKKIDNKTERHTLAAAPKSTYVRPESIAAKQGGLMIWDDDLQKVVKNFFPSPPSAAQMSADPGAGAPGGPDLSSQLAADPAADAGADPVAGNFDGDNSPGTTPDQYVRTAEFSKNPDPDDNFEDWAEPNSEDALTFNDTDKGYKEKDNDDEFAVYDEFWGRSSNYNYDDFNGQSGRTEHPGNDPRWNTHPDAGEVEPTQQAYDAWNKKNPDLHQWEQEQRRNSSVVAASPYDEHFKQGPDPKALMEIAAEPHSALPEPNRKLPHFIRKTQAAAIDEPHLEGHTPEEIRDTINQFRLDGNEEDAQKFIKNRREMQHHEGATDTEGGIDYSEAVEDDNQKSDWQHSPNDGVNGDTDSYNDPDTYQSENWLDEGEWREFDPSEEDDDDITKSSSFQNEAEAEEFNEEAQRIVAEFQRNAAHLMEGNYSQQAEDEDDSGSFRTVASVEGMQKTAGRNFSFAEQQELIDEEGSARHLAELNLDNSFYSA